MLLSAAMDEYNTWRADMYAANTARRHRAFMKMFLEYTGDMHVRQISAQHVRAFMAKRRTEVAASTWNMNLSELKEFFSWCRDMRYMRPDEHPAAGIKTMKVMPSSNRQYIEAEEFPALLDAAKDPRDRALMACGLGMFTRQGELSPIRIGDVNLAAQTIGVTIFKTQEIDTMVLFDDLAEELRVWLNHYAANVSRNLRADDYLFPRMTTARPRAGVKGIAPLEEGADRYVPTQCLVRPYQRMVDVLKAADIYVKGNAGHALRRSGARALYFQLRADGEANAIHIVGAMLHHKTERMTRHYIGVDAEREIRDAVISNRSLGFSRPTLPEGVVDLSERRARAAGDGPPA